ncbi:lycopene cyclase [Streptomyces sp. 3MP-14]|uniref:Lycopene cyclase n=1 Tax=Streptomyces mimosae TaxID=2586635 RepID=A0A5N5ZWN3_9ACTN|nr:MULTISPECIES: lycopene cyclase family protein [Streptomyces]KAB8160302.1 lycopene cyclase [Streptomyces mimosae]KAB8172936.1 lycopene cyclase [Streptomyces sp. 3MP-14]
MRERETEVAIVGAGAAGLSLALRLAHPPPGARPLAVTLVEAPAGPLRPPPRTWCWWEPAGGPFDDWLTASWPRLRVRGPDGETIERGLGDGRYKMLTSADFEARVRERTGAVERREWTVRRVRSGPGGAELLGETAEGRPARLRARWVLDSRPPATPPPARTRLLQHFHGWFLRTPRPAFDPAVVELMDFRVPQPAEGLAFGYVLPLAEDRALVEYTAFSRRPLTDAGYGRALAHYAGRVLGLGDDHRVEAVERGIIPLTDARHRRRAGPAVFRIGAAGGATRPSTGYTFAAVQRQTAAVADALFAGRAPLPPPAYPGRALALDAVLLAALDRGRVRGADVFPRLFREVPIARLLRFLDGRTSPVEDLAVGRRAPALPLLRTVLDLAVRPRRAAPAADARPAPVTR